MTQKVRFCNQFASIFMCVSVWKLIIFLSYSSKHTQHRWCNG